MNEAGAAKADTVRRSRDSDAPKVESVPLAKFTPAPWNPRMIREERFKNLCDSIEADPEFLWRRPVLAMLDGTIYAGNMRYRAAAHLGRKSIPAIVEDVPEQLAKERALRDNAQWGDWNDDQLAEMVYQMAASGSDVKLLGIEEDELARLLGLTGADGTEGLTDPDELPENVPTRSKRGDLWLLGGHRVLCGDATSAEDVARVMGGELATLMVTDPPYGVSVAGGTHDPRDEKNYRSGGTIENDGLTGDRLRDFLAGVFAQAVERLSPGAAWYCFYAGAETRAVMDACERLGGFRHVLVWVKPHFVFGRSDYHYRHEPVMYGWVPGAAHVWLGDRTQDSVWEYEIGGDLAKKQHPTSKPVEVMSKPIRNHCQNGEVVYDPFLGSGTTLIACEQLGRKCYGLEIAENYVDVILQRWENFTGKTAVLQ